MAYATAAQVAEEAGIADGFTASTIPSATRVGEMIAEVEAEIDALLGKKYSVPITAAGSLPIVRGISLALVAERVKNITEVSSAAGEKVDQKSEVSSGTRARKKLQAIVDGILPLPGADLLDSNDGVSYLVSSAGDGTEDDTDEPIFQKGVDQW